MPGGVLLHPGGRTIDEAEHVWLAWISHNISDVHGNAHAAARGAFGQPVVLGALTVAVVVGLAGPAVGPPEVGGAGWSDGWSSIRLGVPVVAGDTITAQSLVQDVVAGPVAATGRVRRTITGRNQRGEVVATIEEEREVPRQGDRSG